MKTIILLLVLFCWGGFSLKAQDDGCGLTIRFKAKKTKLTLKQISELEAFKKKHSADTLGKIGIAATSSKPIRSWKRINNVIDYLSDKNKPHPVDRLRFVFIFPDSMENNSVWLSCPEEEEVPNLIPSPLPAYRL